jgi:chromate transport protein ChrA
MVAGAAVQLGGKVCNSKVTQVLACFSAVFAFYWPKAYVFPSVIIVGGLVTLYTERKKDMKMKDTDEKVREKSRSHTQSRRIHMYT